MGLVTLTSPCGQYGIDLASPTELIAHEKTREDIARHINADDVIYQDLDDLKAACAEASSNGEITDFEIGVFCGTYKTEVPEGYFEHLSENRGKKRKIAAAADPTTATGRSNSPSLAANGGPVNVGPGDETPQDVALRGKNGAVDVNGSVNGTEAVDPRSPVNREDIRYVQPYEPQQIPDGIEGAKWV